MIIKNGDILTLADNNEYVVISKVDYEGKTYYYLLDMNDNTKPLFCYADGDGVTKINDKKLVTKLLPLFADDAMKHIDILN